MISASSVALNVPLLVHVETGLFVSWCVEVEIGLAQESRATTSNLAIAGQVFITAI